VATPQYPSWDAREAAIEEGSGRSAADQWGLAAARALRATARRLGWAAAR